MSESTQVAEISGNILPANIDPQKIEQVFQDNFNQIRFGDLERVIIPSGGGIHWKLDTIDGEKHTEEIQGVIVAWNEARSYFKTRDADHPECYSPDNKRGVGRPGGICEQCPLSQFIDGAPKCKEQRNIYILTPEGVLPLHLVLPPTSLAPFNTYMVRLASKQTSFWETITSFTLKEEKNSEGTKYAVVQVKPVRDLTEQERQEVSNYKYSFSKRVGSSAPPASEQQPRESRAPEEHEDIPDFNVPSEAELEKQVQDEPQSSEESFGGPPGDPGDPPKSNEEVISEASWEDRVPTDLEALRLFTEGLAKRFYIRMHGLGKPHDEAKKWLLELHVLPVGDDISAKDIFADHELIEVTNRAFFKEYGKPLFI